MKKYFVLILSLASVSVAWGMDINDQLISASREGDLKQVEDLLNRGANINAKDSTLGYTPLMRAVEEGQVPVVQLLLTRGADVNLASTFGQTPLMKVLGVLGRDDLSWQQRFSISLAMAKLLLEKEAAVHAVDAHGRSALHVASLNGYSDLVELFLENGAKVDLADKNGETPLMLAARSRDSDTVDLLLWHNADPAILGGEYKESPLMWAANEGQKDACLLILTLISMQDADEIDEHFDKMLSIRRKGGPFPGDIQRLIITKLVESLVADRMKKAIFLMNQTNKEGLTASQIAAKKNHLELAKLLDPKNKASLNEIRNIILVYVKQILFSRPGAINE